MMKNMSGVELLNELESKKLIEEFNQGVADYFFELGISYKKYKKYATTFTYEDYLRGTKLHKKVVCGSQLIALDYSIYILRKPSFKPFKFQNHEIIQVFFLQNIAEVFLNFYDDKVLGRKIDI